MYDYHVIPLVNPTGYNLNTLFVGSEGTLGIVVEATLKLIPKPQCSKVIMAYFDNLEDATSAVTSVIEQQIAPATLDFMDKNAIQTVEKFNPIGLLTNKEAALIIEIDGFKSSIEEQKDIIINTLKRCNSSAIQFSATEREAEQIWQARRSSMGACARLKPNVTTDDLIVPRGNLSKLVLGVREICAKYNLTVCMVGHVGDGSVHPQIPIDYNNEDLTFIVPAKTLAEVTKLIEDNDEQITLNIGKPIDIREISKEELNVARMFGFSEEQFRNYVNRTKK